MDWIHFIWFRRMFVLVGPPCQRHCRVLGFIFQRTLNCVGLKSARRPFYIERVYIHYDYWILMLSLWWQLCEQILSGAMKDHRFASFNIMRSIVGTFKSQTSIRMFGFLQCGGCKAHCPKNEHSTLNLWLYQLSYCCVFVAHLLVWIYLPILLLVSIQAAIILVCVYFLHPVIYLLPILCLT